MSLYDVSIGESVTFFRSRDKGELPHAAIVVALNAFDATPYSVDLLVLTPGAIQMKSACKHILDTPAKGETLQAGGVWDFGPERQRRQALEGRVADLEGQLAELRQQQPAGKPKRASAELVEA